MPLRAQLLGPNRVWHFLVVGWAISAAVIMLNVGNVGATCGPKDEVCASREEIQGDGEVTQQRIDIQIERFKSAIEQDREAIQKFQGTPELADIVEDYRRDIPQSQECLRLWLAAKPHAERKSKVDSGDKTNAVAETPAQKTKEDEFKQRLENAQASAEEALKQMLDDSSQGPSFRALAPDEEPIREGDTTAEAEVSADLALELVLHAIFGEAAIINMLNISSDSMQTPQAAPAETTRPPARFRP